MTTPEGVELLVHIGIDTVSANGEGFKILGKNQEDKVNAGDPVVEVDLKTLSEKFDMSTMLIITNDNGKKIDFIEFGEVKKGQTICTLA